MQFSIDKIAEVREFIKSNRNKRFNVYYSEPNFNLTNTRLFVSASGDICEFNKGSRRYGHRLDYMQYLTGIEVAGRKSNLSDSEVFAKNAKRLVEMLKASGLWKRIVNDIENTYQFNYDKMNEREPDFAHSILKWNVKKMNFRPKYRRYYKEEANELNEMRLEKIKEAMANKVACSVTADGNYDVRFNYDPEKEMAWYSEEYKGCLNGHYYLAINATHAIYYEKD